MDFKEAVNQYAEAPLSMQLLLSILKDYRRPYDKVNELVKQDLLTPIKKGLFIPGIKLNILKPEPFLIANHLRGPSYVSMYSALSYWGFIPERVFEISSVTLKSTKTYHTPIGRFSYYHSQPPYYAVGIKIISLTSKQHILIASPEKALCDTIIGTPGIFLRSKKQTMDYLLDDLRLNGDLLADLHISEIKSWIPISLKKSSLQMLLKTLSE
jgi:hypothetical protein